MNTHNSSWDPLIVTSEGTYNLDSPHYLHTTFGEADGQKEIYDSDGQLILNSDEEVLMKLLPSCNFHILGSRFPHGDADSWKSSSRFYPYFIGTKPPKGGMKYLLRYPYRNVNEFRQYLLTNKKNRNHYSQSTKIDYLRPGRVLFGNGRVGLPLKVFLTNQRIVGIRAPVTSLKSIAVSHWLGGPEAISYERWMKKHGLYRYHQIMLEHIREIIVDTDFLYINPIEDHYKHCPEASQFDILAFRRPIQFIQMQSLLRYISHLPINISFTDWGNERWKNLSQYMTIEGPEGVGQQFDEIGNPIIKGNEVIEEEIRSTVGFLQANPFHRKLSKRWYDVIPPEFGTLYRTNERIIFIRPYCQLDIEYQHPTRLSFISVSLNLGSLNIRSTKEAEIFEINHDRLNHFKLVRYYNNQTALSEYDQRCRKNSLWLPPNESTISKWNGDRVRKRD